MYENSTYMRYYGKLFTIHMFASIFITSAARIAARTMSTKFYRKSHRKKGAYNKIETIVIGTGPDVEFFMRYSAISGSYYDIIAIVDNNEAQINTKFLGTTVHGPFNKFEYIYRKLCKKGYNPQKIIISPSQFDTEGIDGVITLASELGVSIAKLSTSDQIISNTTGTNADTDKIDINPVDIHDLLGRKQHPIDQEELLKNFVNKKVLITGAGGSIGSELCRQLVGLSPSHIILTDAGEFNLYEIDREIRNLVKKDKLPIKIISTILDVREADAIEALVKSTQPNIVLHAAALKHVPIVEENALEGIKTNILGTKNIADICMKHNVEDVVFISTDKAVNSNNAMGATKRVAEKYLISVSNKAKTNFVIVRFGNVLGSRGSVVPLFQEQIAKGGPVTVTHPGMIRFFMTIEEAAKLILYAGNIAKDKKTSETDSKALLCILDMGDPVQIRDLAEKMIRLSGFEPYKSIDITFTGLRPGEKLYEELFYDFERTINDGDESGIFLVATRDYDEEKIKDQINSLVKEKDNKKLVYKLLELAGE